MEHECWKYSLVEVGNESGTVGLLICDECHKIKEVECQHLQNTWHLTVNGEAVGINDPRLFEGDLDAQTSYLVCNLCGMDVT